MRTVYVVEVTPPDPNAVKHYLTPTHELTRVIHRAILVTDMSIAVAEALRYKLSDGWHILCANAHPNRPGPEVKVQGVEICESEEDVEELQGE